MSKKTTINALMAAILERDDWRCHYCNLTINRRVPTWHPRRATIDHKLPRSFGGTNAHDNLVACCTLCNQVKGDMPYDAFIWYRLMRARGETHTDLIEAIEQVFGRRINTQWLPRYTTLP